MQFTELNLIDPLLRAVRDEGYDTPTPIQEQTIPHMLAGRDVLGCAQTGTGKTAAFALPILQKLYGSPNSANTQTSTAKPAANGRNSRTASNGTNSPSRGNYTRSNPPRVLVLTPTRELAAQIGDSFAAYGRHLPVRHTVIFGGVGQQPQVDALRRGVDILVATPGRLLDLMNQRLVRLDNIEFFVLDEADRMLDMGFIHDVKKVLAVLPTVRQNLLYSATMPPEIVELANDFLRDPVHVEVTPTATTVEKIDQYVFFVEKNDKRPLLEKLLRDPVVKRAIVFTRTKHGANKLAKQLTDARINAEAIHGNKSQTAREAALAGFKNGRVRVLVATDIAARGIDVEGISHVINYDLPNIPESYVHRIGRTARAGAEGIAFSFCDQEERAYLRDIERAIRKHLQVVTDHPYPSPLGIPTPTDLNRVGGRSSSGTPNGQRANAPRSSGARPQGDRRPRPAGQHSGDQRSGHQSRSASDANNSGESRSADNRPVRSTNGNGSSSTDRPARRPYGERTNEANSDNSMGSRRPARTASNGNGNGSAERSRSTQRSSVNNRNDDRSPRRDGDRVRERDQSYSSYLDNTNRGFRDRDSSASRSGMREFAQRSRQPESETRWNDSSDYDE